MAGSSNDGAEQKVHVGRQAIYDRHEELAGYELLFRAGPAHDIATAMGAHATSKVIVNTFTVFGLDQLTGGRTAFINVTREFLVGELPLPFEPGNAVLELLETIEIDDTVMEGVRRLVREGYRIAISDLGGEDAATHGHERLLGLASYVKLDVLRTDPELLAAQVKACRRHPNLKLVAERVETADQLGRARDLGFDLFQGYLLGRSQVLSIDALTPSRLRHIELVDQLAREEFDVDKITTMVSADPGLALRVLRATNSAASGLRQKVSSVRNALMLLGMNRLRHWLALMLLSDMGDVDEDCVSFVLVQARFCQELADRTDLCEPDSAFTVGLIAGLAELLDVEPRALVSRLSLDDSVAEAIVAGEGPLGDILSVAHGYVSGRLPDLNGIATYEEIVNIYLSAVEWSTKLVSTVDDSAEDREEQAQAQAQEQV